MGGDGQKELPPREERPPGTAQRRTRVAAPDLGNLLCYHVRIGEVKKRVNYLLVLREAQRAYIEYKRIPPNPRLEGYDYTTLNTINRKVKCHHKTKIIH